MTYPVLDGLVRPYQREMIDVLRRERTWLDCDDCGLGKTRTLLLSPQVDRGILVICPAGVRGLEREPGRPVGGWLAESLRVRPDLKRIRLEGNGKLRAPEPGELCVASYETMRTSACPSFARPMALIFDECHGLKNPKALQTRAADAIVGAVLGAGGTAWGATGTPLVKDPEDLKCLAQVFRLYARAFPGGDRDFGSVFRRELKRQTFGVSRCAKCRVPAEGYHCGEAVKKPKTVTSWVYGVPGPDAAERLRRISLGRMLEHVTDLPDVVEVEHVVELDREALEALGKLAKLSDDELLAAVERERVASDPESHVAKARAALAAAKRAVVGDVIDEIAGAGERVVFFADHRIPVQEQARRSGWGAVLGGEAWTWDGGEQRARREEVVARFAAGGLDGIALTLGSGGTGVDGLQRSARHLVLLEESWSPSLVKQAVGRLRRIGQAGTVVLHKLVSGHEVEARVAAVVEAKMHYLAVVDESRAPLGSW